MLKKNKTEKGKMKPLTKVIIKHGYEYHLVECIRPESLHIPQPKMFGIKNMALSKVVKVKK